ncbi:MAG TPA: hypothetical protein V6D29_19775 [Leptolyngbyaceae cyanobacterium]
MPCAQFIQTIELIMTQALGLTFGLRLWVGCQVRMLWQPGNPAILSATGFSRYRSKRIRSKHI